jgi:hypothetical protein
MVRAAVGLKSARIVWRETVIRSKWLEAAFVLKRDRYLLDGAPLVFWRVGPRASDSPSPGEAWMPE